MKLTGGDIMVIYNMKNGVREWNDFQNYDIITVAIGDDIYMSGKGLIYHLLEMFFFFSIDNLTITVNNQKFI